MFKSQTLSPVTQISARTMDEDIRENKIKIPTINKEYTTGDKAFDSLRTETIDKQLQAIKDLGFSTKNGNKDTKELLKNIAENSDDDKDPTYSHSVQISAQSMLEKIEADSLEKDDQ